MDPTEYDRLERLEMRGKVDMADEWYNRDRAAVKELQRLFGIKISLGEQVATGDLCRHAEFDQWVSDLRAVADIIDRYSTESDYDEPAIPLNNEMFATHFIATKGHWGRPSTVVEYPDWDEVFFGR